MVAREIRVHEALKQRIVDGDQYCSTAILGSIGDTWRVLSNDAARQVRLLEAAGASSHADFGDLILSSRTRQRVYLDGDVDGGIVSLGPAGGFADEIVPAAQIVARLVCDAARAAHAFTRALR